MSRYIDADALWMDIIHAMDYCEDILQIIKSQPTADVRENVHGEWRYTHENGWTCDACGCVITQFINTPYNFCPNCGARMDLREVEK